MLTRWAAWPRGIQWLIGIAAVVLALAIVWALFVPVPDWLAQHDVGSATVPSPQTTPSPQTAPSLQTARDAARGRLLTLLAGLFAVGALLYTARNYSLSRRTFELTEQGQVTERYTKAVEQLGSDKLDVRIGGIYALERVARDSARDHPTVMEVLTAFIREHSHDQWPPPVPSSRMTRITRRERFRARGRKEERSTQPDVQAALTVVGRRAAKRDIQPIDLTRADLTRANLEGANLTGADLTGANLDRATLTGANLVNATLIGVHFSLRKLEFAALLVGADLSFANLTGADLTGAIIDYADLTGARWPVNTPVPGGWRLNAGSGVLERAGGDFKATAARDIIARMTGERKRRGDR
jgi:Pentapeptide repeats (8 copies)